MRYSYALWAFVVLVSAAAGSPIHDPTIELVGMPADLTLGQFQSDTQIRLIYENQVTLKKALPVNTTEPGFYSVSNPPGTDGSLPKGTYDVWLVHFDPTDGRTRITGSITFEGVVRALVTGGAKLNNSDDRVGIAGVLYPTGQTSRGLEFTDNGDSVNWYGKTVELSLRASGNMDEMRILTDPSPEPATWWLLGGGLAGLVVFRRRR